MFPELRLGRGSQLKRRTLGGGDWFLVRKSIMNATFRMVSVSATLLLTACPQNSAVWIQPGSTRDHLVFQLSGDHRSRPQTVYSGSIRVERCLTASETRPDLMWGAAPRNTAVLTSITYGVMPAGYEPLMNQPSKAKVLTPGCYFVGTSGSGNLKFDVLPSGDIVGRSPSH